MASIHVWVFPWKTDISRTYSSIILLIKMVRGTPIQHLIRGCTFMTSSTTPLWLINTDRLSVTYPNGFQVLQPTSLSLQPSDFDVLLGASVACCYNMLRI